MKNNRSDKVVERLWPERFGTAGSDAKPFPDAGRGKIRRAAAGLFSRALRIPEAAGRGPRKPGGDLRRLAGLGVRGWPEKMTLFTRELPPGCRNCLAGSGAFVFVTHRCTRDCFFCPNPKPRADRVYFNSAPVSGPSAIVAIARRYGLRGLGISGGDPLLAPKRTLETIRRLRRDLGPGFHIHLYTNGDRARPELLRKLKRAGLDEIRFDLEATGYRLEPVKSALDYFSDVAVEIPVIPERRKRLESLITDLDRAGVPYLNLHELLYDPANRAALSARGYACKPSAEPLYSLRRPVAGSEEAALRLLGFAKRRTRKLSVYYCSYTTKECLIGPNGRRWREERTGGAPVRDVSNECEKGGRA